MNLTKNRAAISLFVILASANLTMAQDVAKPKPSNTAQINRNDSALIEQVEKVQSESPPVTWDVYWAQGIQVKSSDGNFKMKIGGRIQLDYLRIFPDSYYDTIVAFTQGVEFRRLRFYNSGTIYGNVSYKLQLDFAIGHAVLKDAYINISKIPGIGNLKFGHFKEPVGLEMQNSSNYMTFMERSLTNPLTPERNTGAMIFNSVVKKRMTWAFGYFMPTAVNGSGLYTGNKFHLTGRITGLPIYTTKNTYQVLHLGLSLTNQNQNNSAYILTSRPETHLAPKVLLAEIDVAKYVNQYGVEVSYVLGSWSIQGEYISATAFTAPESTLANSSYNFNALYVHTGFFITGEHRNYKTSAGSFNRVDPEKNFGKGGAGAFEIALRYSILDLDDTDVTGGTMLDWTIGLNWYLNPSTRFMFNYVLTDVRNQGRLNSFQTRFQIFF